MKILNISVAAVGIALLAGVLTYQSKDENKVSQNIKNERLEQLKKGKLDIRLPGGNLLNFYFNKANAEEGQVGDASCDANLTAVENALPNYQHGALSHFNQTLYQINDINAANIQNVFCHFDKSMGIVADLSNLSSGSQTETKTFGDITVKVTIEESSITGYAAKATVSVTPSSGTEQNYMVIHWGYADGTDLASIPDTTKTKGFLIEGFMKDGIGSTRAGYTKWDLTTAIQETTVLAAEFNSAESDSAGNIKPETYYVKNIDTSNQNGNRAYYGRFKLNTTTNAVQVQAVQIERERGTESPSGFGCFKFYAIGTKGGTLITTKSRDDNAGDNYNKLGHFTVGKTSGDGSANAENFDDMDGFCGPDLTTTVNMTGNMKDGSDSTTDWETRIHTALNSGGNNTVAESTKVFDISCTDLNEMEGSSSKPFVDTSTSWVDFNATPDEIFPPSDKASDLNTPTELCDNDADGNGTDDTTKCLCSSSS